MVLLLFWVMCGVATSMIFKNKGQDPTGGFFLGALLGPFGILFALFWSKNEDTVERRAVASGTSRKCPDCAELIKAEARKCRYCGTELEPVEASSFASISSSGRVPGHSPKCGCKRCYGRG